MAVVCDHHPGVPGVLARKVLSACIGVRMAKTIGVHDGGGRIRNSEGGVNEKEIFWKQARCQKHRQGVE